MKFNKASLFAAATLCLMIAPISSMGADAEPQDTFVAFQGGQVPIEGKSRTEIYDVPGFNEKGWAEVKAFSAGVSTNGDARSGVNLDDVVFSKYLDVASTALFINAVNGAVFEEVAFVTRTNQKSFYVVTLKNAVIKSIKQTQEGDNEAEERVSLDYQTICMKTLSSDTDGRLGGRDQCFDKATGSVY